MTKSSFVTVGAGHHHQPWYSWEQCPATSHSGGRYYDHARNAHIELSSVEVVGPSSTCQLADLPESRHGHAASRLGDSVVVCGGLSGRHIHERWEYTSVFVRRGRDKGIRRSSSLKKHHLASLLNSTENCFLVFFFVGKGWIFLSF